MVFMKKIFSHIILSMKTFNHVIISMVTKIQVGTKTWHIWLYDNKMVNSHICPTHKCQILAYCMNHQKNGRKPWKNSHEMMHFMIIIFYLNYLPKLERNLEEVLRCFVKPHPTCSAVVDFHKYTNLVWSY
jgi:hypothetical protein